MLLRIRVLATRNIYYILTKEESMYTFKVENISQRFKHLCTKKLKSVHFGLSQREIRAFSMRFIFCGFLPSCWVFQ